MFYFWATYNPSANQKLTKKLSEYARKEAQVAGYVICHCRWKRLHNSIYAKYSLKKLYEHGSIRILIEEDEQTINLIVGVAKKYLQIQFTLDKESDKTYSR